MSTWFTEQVKDGTIKTGVEFIKAVSNAYHQGDGFTADGNMVKIYTPKYKEADPKYFEKYQAALEELREYENASVEDLIKDVNERRTKFLLCTEHQRMDLIEKNKKYQKIYEEINIWNSPSEMFEKMKQSALSELKNEYEMNKKAIEDFEIELNNLPKTTNEYYADEIFKKLGELKDKAVKAFERWQEHLIDVKKHNLYIQQLDESLQGESHELDQV